MRVSHSLVLLASAIACACGSSTSHRAVVNDEGGIDSGGGGARMAASGGSRNRTPDAGRVARDTGAPTIADARAADARGHGGADSSLDGGSPPDASADAGPLLGEFCNFADPNLESFVRNELSRQNFDGGVPSGPIPVVIAARVRSLDLFCDCSDVLDFVGVECLTGLQSLLLAGAYTSIERLAFAPALTEIRFQYTDTLPAELASLKQLQRLDLNGNQISDLTPIAGLTSLTDIDLSGNPVGDASMLSGLVNLKTLRLQSTQVVDLAPLSALKKLELLNIASNQITDLSPISGLKALTRLEAGQNAFTDLTPLTGLTNLAYLDVYSQAALKDFSPLVANAGLGAGDELYASPLQADCASFKADAKTLSDRGVVLTGFPTCP